MFDLLALVLYGYIPSNFETVKETYISPRISDLPHGFI